MCDTIMRTNIERHIVLSAAPEKINCYILFFFFYTFLAKFEHHDLVLHHVTCQLGLGFSTDFCSDDIFS